MKKQAMQLYKYAHRKDAISMVTHGSFRIGTLYKYRMLKKHVKQIGNEEEASLNKCIDDEVLEIDGPQDVPDFIKEAFFVRGGKQI